MAAPLKRSSRPHWVGRVFHIVQKEFIQVRRDRRMLPFLFIAPVFQLIVFGYAVNTDVRHVSTAVCNDDQGTEGRSLVRALSSSGYFDINYYPKDMEEADLLLDRGKVSIAIHLPRDLSADINRGEPGKVQLVFDASDSSTASVALGYAAQVVRTRSLELVRAQAARRGQRGQVALPLEPVPRVWYNPDLKSRNYNIPGVLCVIVFIVTLMMTASVVVREREMGTLEQLVVTPIRPLELMLGKTIPFFILGLAEVAFILSVSALWFRVPIKGSVPLLFGLAAVFLLTSLGLGLFVSTVSRTQQQALLGSFFIVLPSVLLSGFVFPVEFLPRVLQWATYLIPARYFLTITRGIFLKGLGIHALAQDATILAVYGVIIFLLSAARFRKRVA